MISLAWLVVSSLVWGAALFAVGWLLQRSSDLSGRARQWIWRGCAFLLVAPWIAAPLVSGFGLGLAPVIETVASFEATSVDAAPVFLPVSDAAAVTPVPSQVFALPDIDWEGTLLAVLIAGWLVRFVMAQFAARRLGGVVANSRPAEAGVALDALDAWSVRLGLTRKPDLRLVEANISPFSYGVVRPVICLPEGLDYKLGREPLQLVVAHECLHVARGDGWLRPIERVIADIFWFNPFAWAVRRELDMARELACDEVVVELSSARHAYARTLRDVAGLSAGLSASAPAASMSLAGGGRAVVLRVKRTLALAKRKPARAALVAAVVLGLVGAPIAVAQVVLTTPRPPAVPEAPEAPEVPEPAEPAEPFEIAPASPAPEAPPAPVAPADESAPVNEPSAAAEATPESLIAPLPPTSRAAPSIGVAPTPAPTPRARPAPSVAPAPQQAPAPPEARSLVWADRKTELVALGGKSVDRIRLRYDFDGEWLIDTQNILYRDDARDYYLVTLKEACEQLEIRSLRFRFYPSWSWQLRADRTYDVRPQVGAHCDVAKIEQVDRARADALRAASLRRIW